MKLSLRSARILDFDIENRPLNYGGGDFTFSEVTAIAWSFGPRDMRCRLLGRHTAIIMLEEFVQHYDEADIVTGHYIRKHDLPAINGALKEYGYGPLKPKLTIDTFLDLKPIHGVGKSQENLSTLFGIAEPKIGMSQAMWRQANRLTPEGITLTERRVIGDVRQHQALRLKLTEAGWLNPPKMWSAD